MDLVPENLVVRQETSDGYLDVNPLAPAPSAGAAASGAAYMEVGDAPSGSYLEVTPAGGSTGGSAGEYLELQSGAADEYLELTGGAAPAPPARRGNDEYLELATGGRSDGSDEEDLGFL